jgi:hypothetical protein
LPRKFKIAIAIPPNNDVDVFANDIGLIAIIEEGKLIGFNIAIGGGLATTHGNPDTYARLGTVTCFNLLSGGSCFTSVPNVSISGTPLAPTHSIDYLSAYLSSADGVAHSFSYSKPTGSLTVADLSLLGGATGITTLSGNITLSAPNLNIPIMAPRLNDPLNTNQYVTNGCGELVVNPNYNPAYTIPSTLNSGGNIYLSSTVTAGKISLAVVPVFDNAAWNNPPSGSVVNPVIQALSANTLVSMTANRIELGADGTNIPPDSNLNTPLIAANTTSGVVTLQTYTAGRAITLGDKTAVDSNFTPAELSNIQGNILRIGNSTAGAILVDDLISLSTTRLTGAFSLIGNSTIGDSGGGTGISYAGGLRLSANSLGGLLPLLNNNVINFTGTGNNFGTVAANSNGNILNPNCYNIVLSSGAFSIGTADSLTGITALGSRVTLQPNVVGTTINLGLTRPSTDWGFSDAELDLITASILRIGRNDALASGQITVSGPVTLSASKVPTLSLKTGAGLADLGVTTTSGLSVQSLAVDSGSGGISLIGQGNNVSNLAANVAVSGNVSFTDYYNPILYPNNLFSPPLNITLVDDIVGINTSAGNGAITLTADDMNIVRAVQSGSGVITLQPLTLDTNISLNDPSNSLSLTATELQLLSTSTTVVIGNALGTGTISLGGSGNIDLSAKNYSLTLRGASSPLVFSAPVLPAVTGGLTLANNQTLTLDLGTGAVTSPFAGTDVTIGGATGTLLITRAGSVGTSTAPLTTAVAKLSGALIAAASTATSSGLFLRNATAMDVTGAVSVTGNTSALGNISLTTIAGGLSNSTGSITSTDGSVTLLGSTTVTIGRAVSAATTLMATASGGALVTGAAGTLTAGGNITGTATTFITLDGAVNSGGAITATAAGGDLVTGAAGTLTAGGNVTGAGTTAVTLAGAVNSGGAISFTATTPLTGTFANSAPITSRLQNPLNSDGTFSPTITLQADTVNLGAVVTAQPIDPTGKLSGGILLEPVSVGRNIEVFGATQTVLPGFFIGNTAFGFLGGTAPVTIGRLDGTGTVLVHSSQTVYPTGINRNLTIQAGAQPFSLTPTFTIDGSVTTTGSDLAFNGGGGYLLLDAGTTIDSGSGSISLTGQKVEINGDVVAGFIGNVYNGGTGGAYLNYVGPPAPAVNDLVLSGTGTITTEIFGFGGNGIVYVGGTIVGGSSSIGGVAINSQGLTLSSLTKISLEGDIISTGDPLTIDGNLYLTGNRVISMAGGDLKLLGGVNSLNGLENLNLNMGAGALTLAGGTSTDRIGTLTVTQGVGSTIQLGQALAAGQPELGLTMGFTENFNLTSAVTLQGTQNISLSGYNGADLVLGNFSEATSATAPLSLTTVGGGNITAGTVSASALTVASSGAANLSGAVVTTGASSLTTGTTLATRAITASTLNVSAGTSASLSGAVITSAAGGITVSTPTLTTGSTMSAALGNISFAVNSMNLAGVATAQTGNGVLQPFTSGNDLNLGTQVAASSILKLQAPNGNVTFQTSGAGRIMLTGPINLSSSGTGDYNLVTAGGNVVFSGSSPVLTLPTSGLLSLDLGNGNVISSGGTDYAASQGQLLIVSAGNVTIGTDIPTFGVPGVVSSPASLTLRNAGSLSLIGPIDTGNRNVTIQTLSGNLTLASTIAGGTIQLGAARNFNNQAGASPFTNRNGGRTLVYSYGQGYDNPYNFAGLNGFGVAFGRGFGSMPGSGNFLVYSSYADVGLANGWQYGSFFAGNSVSALMPYGLFQDVDRMYMPNARSFNLEYILYPDRVEPETLTIPKSALGNLEETLGRPPTLQEIQQREVAIREAAMVKKGAIMERSSFDPAIQEKEEEERAQGEKVENSDGGVPQAKIERIEPIRDGAKPMARLPVSAPQAGKSPTNKQGSNGPILRAGPIRSVALLRPAAPSEGSHADILSRQSALLDAKSVIEQERASAEVGIAPPIAAGR